MHSILCIHQGFELYGSDRSFIRSVQALKELYPKSQITVVLPRGGSLSNHLIPMVDSLKILPLGILRKSDFTNIHINNILRLFTGIIPAWKLMREHELIYINSIVVLDCILAVRFTTGHSFIHIREIPTGWMTSFFSRILFWSRSHLIFNSKATKAAFSLKKVQKQTIIYNGTAGFPQKQACHVKPKRLNLLLMGRLNAGKGQPLLLQAIQLLKNHKKTLAVRIVGDFFDGQKHYLDELIALRKNLNLETIVKILPFAENPEIHYSWAHIVIVPSIYPESFGLVAIEGMSAGKPVIGSNHGGLSEIIVHKDTGILFEPRNAHALANAIKFFLDAPELIQKYGESGKIRFNKLFSEAHYISAFKDCISQNTPS